MYNYVILKKYFATISKPDNIENKLSIINHDFFIHHSNTKYNTVVCMVEVYNVSNQLIEVSLDSEKTVSETKNPAINPIHITNQNGFLPIS